MFKQPHKAVLLNIPVNLLEQIDSACDALKVTRSDLIRRSLGRDIQFVMNHEVLPARQREEELRQRYANMLGAPVVA